MSLPDAICYLENAMTEIRFYHLTRSSLEQTLPRLLEKTLEAGWRAVVLAGSPERAEAIAQHLWTYRQDAFLPHGSRRDGNPELQPIWIASSDERPNGAQVLFLVDGMRTSKAEEYDRVCDIFDGNDGESLVAARSRWKEAKATGGELSYWQQDGDKWSRLDV